MLFSSIAFIYYFLPIFLFIYYITKDKHKNKIILLFSLLFYFLGEPKYIIILLSSCIINYIIGKKIEEKNKKKKYLIIGLIYNLGQLFIFKYTDFFITNINFLFETNIPLTYLKTIGISFFTFQAIGYLIDIYNNKHKSCSTFTELATYICMFPQLIAGPIVRYIDIKKELNERTHNFNKFSEGVKRFTIGLSKKVLLANVLGEFTKSLTETSILSSWLKPIGYTLQIYFDFSGYSDMAIGLGLMMGIRFLENFNYPLIANSITDFWRRWHMSLSYWFRDYLYIPLGGNKVSNTKWIRNIFIVWFLTGFWHGANWNFIIWGLYFGIILVIEKIFIKKYLDKTKIIKYIYSSIIIIISFLIFSTTNIHVIYKELQNMFFINNIPFTTKITTYYFKSYFILLIISIIAATPLLKIIVNKLNKTKLKYIFNIIEPIIYLILLTLSTGFLIDDSFNPFLYFRF